MIRRPPRSTLSPTRRSSDLVPLGGVVLSRKVLDVLESDPTYTLRHGHTYSGHPTACAAGLVAMDITEREGDRKSTRLNSSHANISYAVFCLKKKKHCTPLLS